MPSDPQLSQAVQGFLSQMWQHVDATIRAMIGHHREQHEPGGKDAVRIPLEFLANVNATVPMDGDVLTYQELEQYTGTWIAAAPEGGGGSAHQVYAYIALPTTENPVPLGPINLSGATRTISKINYKSDGEISGTCSGGSFAFAEGGGEDLDTGLSASWSDGARLSVSVSAEGTDGTYLIIDWLVT
jgi:hypothetical protein